MAPGNPESKRLKSPMGKAEGDLEPADQGSPQTDNPAEDICLLIPGAEGANIEVLPVKRIDPIFISLDETNMSKRWIWEQPNWPKFEWDRQRLMEPLGGARKAQGRLQMARELLSPELTKEALAAILKWEGINTSAIEGKYLNPESVAASVARRLGMPKVGKTPPDFQADALVSVMLDAVDTYKEPLALDRILSWQKAMLEEEQSSLHRVVTGDLRPDEVEVKSGVVGKSTVYFMGVPKAQLDENMKTFLDWFNMPDTRMDGLVRAGIAHLWFVTIHPFEDGNGRVTRAITDRAVAQDEQNPQTLFRMSTRIHKVKGDYYQSLQTAQDFQNGLVITPWLEWFLQQVEEACKNSEDIIRNTLAKAKFWARHHTDDINERQRKVLNRLLDAGRDGFEGGLTNKKYVSMTKVGQATAYRDIEELLSIGGLVQLDKGGRSTAYNLPWDDLLS